MKFLADENFPRPVLWLLRDAGNDVRSVAEECPGSSDEEVAELCDQDERVLLTFDKDFGDLYRLSPLAPPSGLILFRFRRPTSPDAQRRILDVLTSQSDWAGQFCVVGPDKVRVHTARE